MKRFRWIVWTGAIEASMNMAHLWLGLDWIPLITQTVVGATLAAVACEGLDALGIVFTDLAAEFRAEARKGKRR